MVWIVVRTHPKKEDIARDNIEAQGHETYMPVLREVHQLSRRKREVREGLMFPRYVFVNITHRWRHLLNTRGVAGVMLTSTEQGPAVMSHHVINELRSREHAGVIELSVGKQPLIFRAGQTVRVEGGCFAGRVGIYHGSSSSEREQVLLNVLGRLTPISVESKFLAAC